MPSTVRQAPSGRFGVPGHEHGKIVLDVYCYPLSLLVMEQYQFPLGGLALNKNLPKSTAALTETDTILSGRSTRPPAPPLRRSHLFSLSCPLATQHPWEASVHQVRPCLSSFPCSEGVPGHVIPLSFLSSCLSPSLARARKAGFET